MTDNATSGPGPHQQKRARAGFGYGFAAYGIWGLLPLYFVVLAPATAYEIVALRIVFSLVVCLLMLAVTHSVGRFIRLFRDGSAVLALTVAGVLIAGNWLLYTVATTTGHTLEASLGYFINPLVAILLGVLVLHEKLRPLQWTAIAVGALAVVAGVVLLDLVTRGLTPGDRGEVHEIAGVPEDLPRVGRLGHVVTGGLPRVSQGVLAGQHQEDLLHGLDVHGSPFRGRAVRTTWHHSRHRTVGGVRAFTVGMLHPPRRREKARC